MKHIKTIRCTCTMMPIQLEGLTTDGEPVYIRQRHGELSLAIGPISRDPATWDLTPVVIQCDWINDYSDEYTQETHETIRELLRDYIQLPTEMIR